MHQVAIEAREDGFIWLFNRSLDSLVVYYIEQGSIGHEQRVLEEAESMVFGVDGYPAEIYVGDVDVQLYPIVISGPCKMLLDIHGNL
jgi:hypothetical protein